MNRIKGNTISESASALPTTTRQAAPLQSLNLANGLLELRHSVMDPVASEGPELSRWQVWDIAMAVRTTSAACTAHSQSSPSAAQNTKNVDSLLFWEAEEQKWWHEVSNASAVPTTSTTCAFTMGLRIQYSCALWEFYKKKIMYVRIRVD